MRGYGQFCWVAKAAELFCERWTALIIRDLAAGAVRFSELQRGVPLMSPSLLSRRLKELEAEGVVERRRRRSTRAWTYHLTEAGAELVPMVEALGAWGRRWARRELAEDDIDLGLLLWWLERRACPDAFGRDRAVVRLDLTDQPDIQARWWFLNEGESCTLCFKDPGFETDLSLASTLPDIIRVVRGDLGLAEALASGRMEATGSTGARQALARWLNLAPLPRARPPHERAAG